MSSDAAVWEDVAATWRRSRGALALRAYSDLVNRDLLERWLPERMGIVLKTDLFDEVAGEGLVPSLAARAEHVVGVDLSPSVVREAARRNPGLEAVVADVRSLPFENASFDVVVSNSTLDHFSTSAEVDVALVELVRVLRPGGVLVVTLDNGDNPLVRLRNALPPGLVRRLGLVPYPVGVTHGPRGLREAVTRAGLIVDDSSVVAHVPRLFVRATGWRSQRLLAAERAERSRTRALTGQFVAVRARVPQTRDGAALEPAVHAPRSRVSTARALVERALSATVMRRLTLLELDLGRRPPDPEPSVPLTFGFLPAEDVAELEGLRPRLGTVARERFAHGELCFVARAPGGEVVGMRWVALDNARIEFLGCSFRLRDGEAYSFDAWTRPGFRGQGVASTTGARLDAALEAEGIRKRLRAVWPANEDGLRNAEREGFVTAGSIVALRIGPLRRVRLRRTAPP